MKALVTGAAGFIGSHLTEALLKLGMHVVAIDNLRIGREESLPEHPNLQFVQADVQDRSIHPLFDGVDWVFHLAAMADIVPSIQNPALYYEANVSGTLNVLEAARAANIKRFVYTASSSCYGLPDEYPTKESAEIRPMYPYALTKYLGEVTAMHWAQVYKMPIVSLRLFNVFGPRARTTGQYGAVFGVFLAQKLAGKPFTVVGDGTQTRDFTYVSDVVDAFIAAAKSEAMGEIYNIGSGGTYSVNHLVDLLQGERIPLPKRPGEPDCTFACIDKALHDLDWSPKIPFEEGVAKMLNVIDQWQGAPVWEQAAIEEATKEWFTCLGS